MKRANISDVARVAGTSRKTVSRVINNEPNVHPSTRKQVLDAIAKLKYRPLTSARSLASNRSFMIGLLYDNRSPSYIMAVQAGVLEACEAQHYSMMVQPLVSAATDFVERVDDILTRHRPDGLILTPPITDHAALLKSLRNSGIPFASISPRHPEKRVGVILREREAAAAMMAHLVSLGHTRIAHIVGDLEHGAGVWRLAGYRDGLKAAGLKEIPAYMVPGRFSFESGVAAARKLLALRQRPTAIFAADDDMATGTIWAASEAGLSVPGDVSVCGFDDTTIAMQVWPPLTTIHQPVQEMARLATEELLRLVLGKGEAGMVELDYEIRIRASTGPRP
ncbi:MAG TPA: LacI family DNA-binding transcriptional regulator [Rhodanobacteraceae bacterium]